MGLRVPDDVIMLLSDDNLGKCTSFCQMRKKENIPEAGESIIMWTMWELPETQNGFNVTPIQNMWEQLQLTYDYGVDKLWVLNVGDFETDGISYHFIPRHGLES